MPNNQFENSRISEGTLQYGANEVGPTARADVPEQIKNGEPGKTEFPDSGELRVRNALPEENANPDEDAAPDRNRRYRRVLSAGSLIGDRVHNAAGESLGTIEQIMIDMATGRVAYAVLSFGGFLGLGDKLFAVPWGALRLDTTAEQFILDVDRRTLENAPGFDKGTWPDMADAAFGRQVHSHYGRAADSGHGVESTQGGTHQVFEQTVTDAGDYTGDNAQSNRSMEFEPVEGYRIKQN